MAIVSAHTLVRVSKRLLGTTPLWLVAALCLAMLGCGQTGPLYLPDERQTEPAAEPPANP